MNVFDFDGTLYRGDSTWDFFWFCLKRRPSVVRVFPIQIWGTVSYLLGGSDKTRWKERFYSFLRCINDIDAMTEEFWKQNIKKMDEGIISLAKPGDLVISASPEFLLRHPCGRFGFRLIASRVDQATGITTGENCHGQEKVSRFRGEYPHEIVECFYSDSQSDLPMASLAQHAYIVSKGTLSDW